jgi:hypothetical protein
MWQEIILHGLANSLWIVGVYNAALPGQILDPVATWMAGDSKAVPPIEGNIPDWINKPLFLCPMCCASFHGAVWWAVFQPFPAILLPVYIVCLSGFMKVVTILVLNRDY